jgi:hypothetical protein
MKQEAIGLNSRSEANYKLNDRYLPIITAPMYGVCNTKNEQIYRNEGIETCLPRGIVSKNGFTSYSLEDFIIQFIEGIVNIDKPLKVLIDTANGNMPKLHYAIREAKRIYGDNMFIIAGNIGSEDAFVELAKTGVDAIRVGIGGGSVCSTTRNTGIGNEKDNLLYLIERCYHQKTARELSTLIIADGISNYITQNLHRWNDNGYAAINSLLYEGADMVMLGTILAQTYESSSIKKIAGNSKGRFDLESFNKRFRVGCSPHLSLGEILHHPDGWYLVAEMSGMSTHNAQQQYNKEELRPSEGIIKEINVKYSLKDWLYGSEFQDKNGLMGWTNSIKSCMAYNGAKNLKEFKK